MRGIRWSRLALAFASLILLEGCMTSNDGDTNAPLPRMSRQDAQTWAAHFAESMARSAGAPIDATSVKPQFSDCVGKNDEVAHDGRFYLTYRAEVPLPAHKQGSAGARIRDDLQKRGYEITSFRDDDTVDPAVVLEAYNPDQDFSIRVAGYKAPEVLNLGVFTPCLLPPGVKQEQL
ncbi:conserved exported hypothetical protein [Actinacidiphila cocklensis]|uniref:Lipoprotein n=2 Tax=Actinacidiphila cocklensis TaxID=887465 RepID=A0A9W4DKJ0_9ACTN|nr:conserved exported hypothetical protein [Actinacidiphila cocklensis]